MTEEKKEKTIDNSVLPININIPTVTLTLPIQLNTATLMKKLLENKNLWKIVVYSSLLEFYYKIRLKSYFEAHKIQQKKWLEHFEKLTLGQIRQELKDLELIDDKTNKLIEKIVESRNKVVHNIVVSSIFIGDSEAEEVAKWAEQCISNLSSF